MATIPDTGDDIWDRIERAVEKVKDRLRRVSKALDDAGIPYAVIGESAAQLYVAQVDEAAIRNTRDVDILLRRDDMPKVIEALGKLGFVHPSPTVARIARLAGGLKTWLIASK